MKCLNKNKFTCDIIKNIGGSMNMLAERLGEFE